MTPEIKQDMLDILGSHTRLGGRDAGWNEPSHCSGCAWNSDRSTRTFHEHLLAKLAPVMEPAVVEPRVWFNDEAPPTGTLVMDTGGRVWRWNWDEDFNQPDQDDQVFHIGSHPLVEVLIRVPHYAEAVARAEAARKEKTDV